MKKMTAFLLSFALLTLSGCAAEETNAEPQFRQNTYTSEYLTDGNVVSVFRAESTYSSEGALTGWVEYEDGLKTKNASYEYDENGNLLRYTVTSDTESVVNEMQYVLDDQKRILRKEEYRNGTLAYSEENSYDTKGRITASTMTYDSDDGSQGITQREYTYNWRGELEQCKTTRIPNGNYSLMTYENGMEHQLTQFDAQGVMTEYVSYIYDDAGFHSQWIRCGSDGTVEHTCKRIPDETGLVITELHYDAKGFQTNHHDVFTYDEYGNLLMQERYEDGEVYWRISYTYEKISLTE